MSDRAPRTRAYVRLSRDDLAKPGSLEEKFQVRAQICRDLAARYGLDLADSDIEYELKSGTKLSARPAMLRILEEARARRFDVLISAYQDRVLRGDKRDEQDIEDTFIRGRIRLLTTEGEIDFGDEDYDPSLWEFRAMAGRAEVRRYSKRRRETHKANAKLGRRDQGFAPYGYVWIPTQTDPVTREVKTRGHYELIPEEYEVVKELFGRAFSESVYSICRELNRRYEATGKPLPPGHRRRPLAAASEWRPSTLERILKNPFYAGYPAQRSRIIHGERRWLAEAEWVMPESEQEYEHPISLAQYYQLRRILSERTRPGAPNTDSDWPLTGILFCAEGSPMHSGGRQCYACSCKQAGREHPGMYIQRPFIEAVAVQAMARIVAALPEDALPKPDSRSDAESQYRDARQELNRVRQKIADLEENFGLLIRSWGREKYEQAYADVQRDLEIAEARLAAEECKLAEPVPEITRSAVEIIRSAGVEAIWQEANPQERRDLVSIFLRRIVLVATPHKWAHQRWCRVETHAYAKPYYKGGKLRIPKSQKPSLKAS